MYTAFDISNMAHKFLAQTQGSIVAGLPSGGGENDDYTVSAPMQELLWMTEGQNRLARLCVPIDDTATLTPPSAGASPLGPYPAVVSANLRTLHRPKQVFIGTRALQTANVGYLAAVGRYPALPSGDPIAWADTNAGIAVSTYTTSPTFTLVGFFLPQALKYSFTGATTSGSAITLPAANPLSIRPMPGDQILLSGGSVTTGIYTVAGTADAPGVVATGLTLTSAPGNSVANVSGYSPLDPFLDDYAVRAIAWYLAWMIAQTNADNSVLAERIPMCFNEWAGAVKEIYTRVVENDPTLSGFFTPAPIDAMVQIVKQSSPRT